MDSLFLNSLEQRLSAALITNRGLIIQRVCCVKLPQVKIRMLKHSIVQKFVLVTLILGFGTANAADIDDINKLVDHFHKSAASADFDGYFASFAPDAHFLGTDATERWGVDDFKQYAAPAFASGKGWTYKVLSRNVETRTTSGDVAWFDEILANNHLGRCRGTGVVLRTEAGWKIVHYSLTLLIPNAIADEVGRQTMAVDGLQGQ